MSITVHLMPGPRLRNGEQTCRVQLRKHLLSICYVLGLGQLSYVGHMEMDKTQFQLWEVITQQGDAHLTQRAAIQGRM